jgi:hypothetical protein
MRPRMMTLAVAVALFTALAPGTSIAQMGVPIQPGTRVSVVDPEGEQGKRGFSFCTLGFFYEGRGTVEGVVYASFASHCTNEVGQDVVIHETGETIGDVAAFGKQEAPGVPESIETDWALIEIREEYLDRASPALKGYPQYPTGLTSHAATEQGDEILLSPLPDERKGALVDDEQGRYRISGPVVPSDSGGPLVHLPSGEALGTVSAGDDCLFGPFECETYTGPTVHGIVPQMAAAGFPVELMTVGG